MCSFEGDVIAFTFQLHVQELLLCARRPSENDYHTDNRTYRVLDIDFQRALFQHQGGTRLLLLLLLLLLLPPLSFLHLPSLNNIPFPSGASIAPLPPVLAAAGQLLGTSSRQICGSGRRLPADRDNVSARPAAGAA